MKRTSRKLKGKSKGSRPIRQNRPNYKKEIIGFKRSHINPKFKKVKIKGKNYQK